MRVLLVEPPLTKHDVGSGIIALAEPLGLECAASTLAGHDVRLLDMRLDRRLDRALESFRPHVVGTGGCTVGVKGIRRLLAEVKRFDPAIRTVVGGHHATVQPQDFLDPQIDAAVVGEGETTFPELLAAWDAGRGLDDVAGLALRGPDGGLRRTPERPLADLDSLPRPARHLVQHYRPHYFRGPWRPIASVYTSRGCPHRCAFCGMWKVHRGQYRTRSVEKIVAELRELPETRIDLTDDNTFDNVAWAARLAQAIRDAGIRKEYKVYARADTVAANPDLVRSWRQAGLRLALVGFESFREDDLQAWNKRNSLETNARAVEVLQANEVEIASYFVIHPEYLPADFAALKRHIDARRLTQPVFTMLTPFPGTDLYEQVRDRITHRDFELCDFFHVVLPTRMPERDFYREFVGLYRHAYAIRRMRRFARKSFFSGLSWAQIRMRQRFFSQLRALPRTDFP